MNDDERTAKNATERLRARFAARAGEPQDPDRGAENLDSLGRRIHPEAIRALDEINAKRVVPIGRKNVRIAAHIPTDQAAAYAALTPRQRGDVIAAGLKARNGDKK